MHSYLKYFKKIASLNGYLERLYSLKTLKCYGLKIKASPEAMQYNEESFEKLQKFNFVILSDGLKNERAMKCLKGKKGNQGLLNAKFVRYIQT